MAGVYYCFSAYEGQEQFETGDTLHHNFFIPTWPTEEPGWYLFRGTVSGTWSPSISPIIDCFKPPLWPLTNGGFETWVNPYLAPYGWCDEVRGTGPGEIEREDTIVKTGNYSAKLTTQNPTTQAELYQYFSVSHLIGQIVTFIAWAYAPPPSQYVISLLIPGAVSWSYISGPHYNWRQITKSFTVGPTASWGRVILRGYSQTAQKHILYLDTLSIG